MSRSRTSSKITEPSRKIVVLTAPSGSGKTSIARGLMQALPELRFSVSATTRPRRPHEREGIDYHFVTPEEFGRLQDAGELLEFQEVYPGRLYGTLRSEVERNAGEAPVLLDIEVKGAANVKKAFPDESFVIFIRPPSLHELERRLRRRGSEDEASFKVRMDRARHEIEYADAFDAVVVNDDLERATIETLQLVRSFLRAPLPKSPEKAGDGAPGPETLDSRD